jgi:hypothetical protein
VKPGSGHDAIASLPLVQETIRPAPVKLTELLARAHSLDVEQQSAHAEIDELFSRLAFWDGMYWDVDAARALIEWIDKV